MDQKEAFEKIVAIVAPFVKNKEALASAGPETSLMKDLQLNSARLIDVMLDMEERFGIRVTDEEADKVQTIGDAIRLVLSKV